MSEPGGWCPDLRGDGIRGRAATDAKECLGGLVCLRGHAHLVDLEKLKIVVSRPLYDQIRH